MIHRISSRAIFRSLSRSRHRVSTPNFTVVWSGGPPDRPAPGVGLACAISRRVGSAVVRNRIRRRVRVVASEWSVAQVDQRGWFLVVVRPGAARLDFVELRAELLGAFDDLLGAV